MEVTFLRYEDLNMTQYILHAGAWPAKPITVAASGHVVYIGHQLTSILHSGNGGLNNDMERLKMRWILVLLSIVELSQAAGEYTI